MVSHLLPSPQTLQLPPLQKEENRAQLLVAYFCASWSSYLFPSLNFRGHCIGEIFFFFLDVIT